MTSCPEKDYPFDKRIIEASLQLQRSKRSKVPDKARHNREEN
jgi:hypothetical protein